MEIEGMPFRITFQGAGRFGKELSATSRQLLAFSQNRHLTTNCTHTMLAFSVSAGAHLLNAAGMRRCRPACRNKTGVKTHGAFDC
jgi:hypothetical protein